MPPAPTGGQDAVRFLDILTTASSIARAQGSEAVTAAHILQALDVLTGLAEVEDVGGPVSPLGHRRTELAVDPSVRELSQRWYARLGGAPEAVVEADGLGELRAEIAALVRS